MASTGPIRFRRFIQDRVHVFMKRVRGAPLRFLRHSNLFLGARLVTHARYLRVLLAFRLFTRLRILCQRGVYGG